MRLAIICLALFLQLCQAWFFGPLPIQDAPPPPPPLWTTSSLVVARMVPSSPQQVKMGAESSPLPFEDAIRGTVKPATEDQPQIMLPENFALDKNLPFVQGVAFLIDSQKRPNPSDVMVFTVRPIAEQDTVVAGAKIPVSKVEFPFRFKMTDKNILPEKADKISGDLVIRVSFCPEETGPQCTEEESEMKGVGLSKLLKNLPATSEGTEIRAGASVGIQ